MYFAHTRIYLTNNMTCAKTGHYWVIWSYFTPVCITDDHLIYEQQVLIVDVPMGIIVSGLLYRIWVCSVAREILCLAFTDLDGVLLPITLNLKNTYLTFIQSEFIPTSQIR